jgi:hypothetical protein
MDRPNLPVVGIDAGRVVHHHGIRVPRIEELADQINIFVCHLVALLARWQPVHTEILRRRILARRDDVPAKVAAGDVVERRAETRQHEGRIRQRRQGGDDAEPRGSRADQGGERRRVVLGNLQRMLQGGFRAVAIRLGHHQGVRDHDIVETGPLQRLCHIDVEPAVPVRTAGGKRMVPLARREVHEPTQMQPLARHRQRPPLWDARSRSKYRASRAAGTPVASRRR